MDKQKAHSYIKRRKYFIDKKFQTKFIMKFCSLAVLSGLLTIWILYFFAMRSTTVAFVNSRVVVTTTADFILPVIIQTVAIVLIIVGIATIVLALLVSFRIAGPLYRLKKHTEAIAKGDLSARFKIRHLDQLQDVATAFDYMVVTLRDDIKEIADNLHMVKEKAAAIPDSDFPDNIKQRMKELRSLLADAEKKIKQFKVS